MHVVQLGYLSEVDGAPNVTLQDPRTRERKGYRLEHPMFELLQSLDPTETVHDFTPEEWHYLRGFARLGIVALTSDHDSVDELTFIPVPRADISFVGMTDSGYQLTSTLGEKFELSEHSTRFLGMADSERSLAEIVSAVHQEALDRVEERPAVEEMERESGASFGEFLEAEAYRFIRALRGNEAVSFEPHTIPVAVEEPSPGHAETGRLSPAGESGE
ncbi:hypothetical protein ACR8AL_05595 [Clavibacter sepedonicus]|nr:hypothetical protein [Clavibacter sp.]MBD5380670.1 hypothetical protein [Clavibacter sp.]